MHRNIILIDGPTGSGKSRYIRALGATPQNTLTSEQLMDVLLQAAKGQGELAMAENLGHITYIENMESLRGREETQKRAAGLVKRLAEKQPVVLTGIDFRDRLPFFLAALGPHTHLFCTDGTVR